MAKKIVNIGFEEDVLAAIDKDAAVLGMSRSGYVNMMMMAVTESADEIGKSDAIAKFTKHLTAAVTKGLEQQ